LRGKRGVREGTATLAGKTPPIENGAKEAELRSEPSLSSLRPDAARVWRANRMATEGDDSMPAKLRDAGGGGDHEHEGDNTGYELGHVVP
jgi:hypothetical protein